MVRGILTQHVMEAVSQEMFGGEQGKQLVEKTLPQIEASTTMPADQKQAADRDARLGAEVLRPAGRAGAAAQPAARHHDAVHGAAKRR